AEPEGPQPGRLGGTRRGTRVLLADRPIGSPRSVLAEVHVRELREVDSSALQLHPSAGFRSPKRCVGDRRRRVLQSSDQRKEVVLILSHMLEGTLEVQGR